MLKISNLVLSGLTLLALASGLRAQEGRAAPALDPSWVKALEWRSIGPAAMGGRITDLAVVESDPATFWVGSASGGVFKTSNGGTTFEAQLQHAGSASVGAICVAPGDPNLVWVGTGEANQRNSSTWGDGVYKSSDGGKTFEHMGLAKTFQIGRVAIHPKNHEIVYVAAAGRLWGPSEERGLYKTTDGGKSWERILFVDERTGCIDVALSPADPQVVLAAMYERQRDGFDGNHPAKRWGAGSGLYKSTDGGASWKRLTAGLPTCQLGRMAIEFYRAKPAVVYLLVESEKIGTGPKPKRSSGGSAYMGINGEDGSGGALLTMVTDGGPAAKAGLRSGDLVVAMGKAKVDSYQAMIAQIRAHKGGEKIKVEARRGEENLIVELTFGSRPRGFGRGGSAYGGRLGGQRENVQDRQGKEGYQTGGLYRSSDAGESWERINSINPRPYYFSLLRVDPSDDSHIVVGGVSLAYSSDGGEKFRANAGRGVHSDHHALWIDPSDGRHMLLGCDGGLYETRDRTKTWRFLDNLPIGQFYHVCLDDRQPYWVYGGLQDNGSWGGPSRLRGRSGPMNRDFVVFGGGDGFVCQVDANDHDQVYYESQNGGMGWVNFRTGRSGRIRPPRTGVKGNRFNWRTPFILSHHNSRIFYCAGGYVFRSLDRGAALRAISPRITRSERGSATALAESPLDPDLLYVGSDDGAVWVTRDGGAEWTDISKNFELPGPRWVSAIEASRFDAGRAYLTFDGHRSDDDAPYVFVTEDFGKSWKAIAAGLPAGSTRVVREDPHNRNLLLLGTEFAAWASLDRGASWTRINANLPTVAVHELAVHPRDGEVVAATHGRSLWVADISALEQMTPEVLAAKAHLFRPTDVVSWGRDPRGRRASGAAHFSGQNPPSGAAIYYLLREKPKEASLVVADLSGKTLRELRMSKEPGLHMVRWNLSRGRRPSRGAAGRRPGVPATSRGAMPFGRGARMGGFASRTGTYQVILKVGGEEYHQRFSVLPDPSFRGRSFPFEEAEGFEGDI